MSADEQSDAMQLIAVIKGYLDKEFMPDGYNIGINCGPDAGQTIGHAHIHIIPRYKGDVDKPQGGVRGVIPHRMGYPQEE